VSDAIAAEADGAETDSATTADAAPEAAGGDAATDAGTGADAGADVAAAVDAASDADGAGAGDGPVVVTDAIGGNQKLGFPCSASIDCAAGLACLPESSKVFYGAGGPAHGICSSLCQTNADFARCGDAGGVCVDVGDGITAVVMCLQRCTAGDTTPVIKCAGRPDMACIALTNNGGQTQNACVPNCSQDSDCSGARKCDAILAICVDTPNPGLPVGSHCPPGAPSGAVADPCAGTCLGLGGTAAAPDISFCTRPCTVGYLNGCNWVPQGASLATGGEHGVCLPVSQANGPGDIGICLQLCETAADCSDQTDPGLLCDRTQVAVIGHGVCVWQ
jgi:hypothetical protein